MTDRITSLVEQAKKSVPAGLAPEQWLEVYHKIFAKLIVKECADFIAPLGDWCGGHGEPRMPSTSECAKKLKEHFGVDE
jgi:hypothetical protein